ncbi:unnamed protein product [Moneuplotes crassus]|uniref:lipoate--protein ligase n=1 Tax=Euplotes crassus TaxID=5936 RepID=A0AAD1XHI9_EUPCR|nr:unnamed protein product [Moneuplotes crassus]
MFNRALGRSFRRYSTMTDPNKFIVPGKGVANILVQESNDVLLNLATEEYLYEHCEIDNPVMFLWRNQRCVIIGKHQNPWKELAVEKVNNDDDIVLARRKSGGGCVYQDLGNAVFSFFTPVKDFQTSDYKTKNNEILIKSLEACGIYGAEASGRNDMVIGDRKISGSAYKINLGKADGSGKKALHHGTMLVDVDFSFLNDYLTPSKKKLESKGVNSVRSRVMNLSEVNPNITYDMWMESMINEFHNKHEDKDVFTKVIPEEQIRQVDKIMEIYEGLNKWEWKYGTTPDFTHSIEHKFTWALMDINFHVRKGLINSGKVYSDCLYPEFIDKINGVLESPKDKVPYDKTGIRQFCNILREELKEDEYYNDIYQHNIDEIEELLVKEI